MEFIDGESLDNRLAKVQGPLPLDFILNVAPKVLSALHYLHTQNIFHRDVKPSNILLDAAGTPFVIDLGIAFAAGQKKLTQAGVAIGTPEYMSPEQIDGRDPDPRNDVYSFGVVLYELLTGRLPFDVPEDLSPIE